MTYIKYFLVLFLIGQHCGAAATSPERYVFDFLSKDWTDDKCKQWPKIDTKKMPSDLDRLQLRGPVKKLTMRLKINNKLSLVIVSTYDKQGILTARVGTNPNQSSAVKLNSEKSIIMPYFHTWTSAIRDTNYEITVDKKQTFEEQRFYQLRETHHAVYPWNKNYRRYVTKGFTIGVRNNNNSAKLDIRILNELTDLRTIKYNPKKRILLHKLGSVLNTYKHDNRSNHVSFDDKDPYPTTFHYDQSGRLVRSSESYSASDWAYHTKEYTWDGKNRVKTLKESFRTNSYKHTITTYSYTKTHYTASTKKCDDKKCKFKLRVKKLCYKRDHHGNSLERIDKVNLILNGTDNHIVVENKYEYYR